MPASTLIALLDLLGVALDHAQELRDLMAKPGGASAEDIKALMDKHDSERARVQLVIDALPDDKAPAA